MSKLFFYSEYNNYYDNIFLIKPIHYKSENNEYILDGRYKFFRLREISVLKDFIVLKHRMRNIDYELENVNILMDLPNKEEKSNQMISFKYNIDLDIYKKKNIYYLCCFKALESRPYEFDSILINVIDRCSKMNIFRIILPEEHTIKHRQVKPRKTLINFNDVYNENNYIEENNKNMTIIKEIFKYYKKLNNYYNKLGLIDYLNENFGYIINTLISITIPKNIDIEDIEDYLSMVCLPIKFFTIERIIDIYNKYLFCDNNKCLLRDHYGNLSTCYLINSNNVNFLRLIAYGGDLRDLSLSMFNFYQFIFNGYFHYLGKNNYSQHVIKYLFDDYNYTQYYLYGKYFIKNVKLNRLVEEIIY